MVLLGNDWDEILKDEFDKPYYKQLREFLKAEYKSRTIYPNMHDIFNALKYTAFKDVKVVIIGQDPYHGENQAHGLCFSVKRGIEPPPSLKNMYKELFDDLSIPHASHGELTSWAKQGVLMLNTVLTVRAASPNSHKGKGWEILTDRIIAAMNEKDHPVVFMLWGGNARAKKSLITNPSHPVLECAHPSPLSAYNGFFGCGHFVKANQFLASRGEKTISWDKINSI